MAVSPGPTALQNGQVPSNCCPFHGVGVEYLLCSLLPTGCDCALPSLVLRLKENLVFLDEAKWDSQCLNDYSVTTESKEL
jgi:hypothetical protein